VSRGAIEAPKGRDMIDPAQTQTLPPAAQHRCAPWPAPNHLSLVTPHCPNQSLAKLNRKPMQLLENK